MECAYVLVSWNCAVLARDTARDNTTDSLNTLGSHGPRPEPLLELDLELELELQLELARVVVGLSRNTPQHRRLNAHHDHN